MSAENNKRLADIKPVDMSACTEHSDGFLDAIQYCYHDILVTRNYATKSRPLPKVNVESFIEKVIFNDPATIIYWVDGTKTVVKRSEDDIWDPEKGFCMAIIKKLHGRTSFIKRYTEEDEEPISTLTAEEACENLKNFGKKLSEVLPKISIK